MLKLVLCVLLLTLPAFTQVQLPSNIPPQCMAQYLGCQGFFDVNTCQCQGTSQTTLRQRCIPTLCPVGQRFSSTTCRCERSLILQQPFLQQPCRATPCQLGQDFNYKTCRCEGTIQIQEPITSSSNVERITQSETQQPPAGGEQIGASGDGQEENDPNAASQSPPPELSGEKLPSESSLPSSAKSFNQPQEMSFRSPSGSQSANEPAMLSSQRCSSSPYFYHWCRTFYTDCPSNGIWVYVRASGFIWFNINGHWLGWFVSFGGRWINIPGRYLKCGCNRICIYVLSWCPWVRYSIYQPRRTCHLQCNRYTSPGLPAIDAFYNSNTCRCECIRNKCCPRGQSRPWLPDRNACRCR